MYSNLQTIHSYWAYLVLLVLIVATINAFSGLASKRAYAQKDLRIPLFALIFSHIQLLIAIALYFVSPYFDILANSGMGTVMKDATLRLFLVEHPLTMVIAIVLITIGFSKHKKKTTDVAKFKTIAVFYGLALLLVLSRIPWAQWFSA
ncbi:MAG: hypothetical protein KKC03_08155 [Bacteroidetes bacterium]|nr:hypothetical protein [Bacteroidota bacterium]